MSPIELSKKLGKRLRQPWFGGGIGALLAVVLGLVLLDRKLDLGKGVRDWSYDLPFLVLNKPVEDVVIIYLDEKTYRDLNQTPVDFDRALHARLVRQLKSAGARMVVFDVLFIDPRKSTNDADVQFAQAMREHGRVVLAAQYQEHKVDDYDLMPPVDPLRDACAGWGIAKIHFDTDFLPRQHYEVTERIPSLGWKSAELFGAQVTKTPERRLQPRWLNYYSPDPFASVSYSDAIQDKPLPYGITFKDKVVFVGAAAIAGFTGDEREQFRTPWTWRTGRYNLGVEDHALTFCNLVRGDWLTRTSNAVEIPLIILCGALLGYGLSLFRPLAASGMAVLFALATTGIAYLLFAKCNLWFPWLIPVAAQAPVALFWSYLFNSVKSYTETKLLETSLALYLSPHQAKKILRQPDLLKPGAKMETITILFSDIANFSKISQRMDANDLVRLLNSYYEASIGCIHQTDGTVVKLIGDAILAIWNAPQLQPDHQERACRAALLINEKLVHFEAASTSLPLHTRIGLHTGNVCVGNIGSSTRFDYTAIGDAVNLASRLEGLNKQLGTSILATREVQRVVESSVVSRLVGHFKFKGFDSVAEVYELVSTADSAEATRPWREAFAKGMWNFQRKLFKEADEHFQLTLVLRPGDGPAGYYLQKIAEFGVITLSREWMGEIDLQEK